MHKLNKKGFAIIETLLIIVALAIVGGTAYFVYKANKDTVKSLDSSLKSSQSVPAKSAKKTEPADPTADWTAYVSPKGSFSLKYPKSWVQPTHPESCGSEILDRTLFLGPDTNSVAKCGSDSFGQIFVASTAGSQITADGSEEEMYKDIVSKDVTVNGVKGQRISKVAAVEPQALGAYPKDTIIVTYIFRTNGNTYKATYAQVPGFQNVLAEFDLMVAQTLKFE